MPSINVVFHSVTGHTFKLAEAIGEGISSLPDCEAHLKQIPELPGIDPITLPALGERKSEFAHVPEAKVEDLLNCDGLALGTTVYWGNMSYATKFFLDTVAKFWKIPSADKSAQPIKELVGKPTTVFTGGGNGLANDPAVLAIWTALSFFGMTIVTVGPRVPEVTDPSRHDGGSPLGAGTFSRCPGDRPSEGELAIARAQGRALAEVTRAWVGRPSD